MSSQNIKIFLKNNIRLNTQDLEPKVLELIKESLLFTNPKFESLKKLKYSTRGVKEKIPLYYQDGISIFFPRGFYKQLKSGLESFNYNVSEVDLRTSKTIELNINPIPLRDHQKASIDLILKNETGLISQPPGSGKTVLSLEMFRRLSQKTIVITDRKNIAEQWKERAKDFLGIECSTIGDGNFDYSKDLTIASIQTLSNVESTDPFYDEFGLVIVDEAHHSSALTWFNVIGNFNAKYVYGVSATPDRENGTYDLVKIAIGDVISEVKRDKLYDDKTLVRPEIRCIETNFYCDYYPSHSKNSCHEYSGCKKDLTTKKTHSNNYSQVTKELTEDVARAKLIATHIKDNQHLKQIVVSKRFKQLDLIASELSNLGVEGVVYLTGKEDLKKRTEVVEFAGKNKCVVLSTLADEALDIPELEVIHLVYPTRNAPLLTQQIGRVERHHKDKDNCVVYDYVDKSTPILWMQFVDRRINVYNKNNYTIKTNFQKR